MIDAQHRIHTDVLGGHQLEFDSRYTLGTHRAVVALAYTPAIVHVLRLHLQTLLNNRSKYYSRAACGRIASGR